VIVHAGSFETNVSQDDAVVNAEGREVAKPSRRHFGVGLSFKSPPHPWRHAELAKHLARSGHPLDSGTVIVHAGSFETNVSLDDAMANIAVVNIARGETEPLPSSPIGNDFKSRALAPEKRGGKHHV
jgi:hypothetical protein